jgi:hypothetical protein
VAVRDFQAVLEAAGLFKAVLGEQQFQVKETLAVRVLPPAMRLAVEAAKVLQVPQGLEAITPETVAQVSVLR